jgi:hypothetical protein
VAQKTEEQAIGPAYERSVAVCGRLQNIIVYQKSKTVWVAGKYMGENHQSQGSTANALAEHMFRYRRMRLSSEHYRYGSGD